jgi:hypothetical protein
MKHLIWAVAASPLLIAATPAPPAAPAAPGLDLETGARAGAIFDRVHGQRGRLVFDFSIDDDHAWTDEHDAVLDEAMNSLREALAALPGEIDADMRFDWRSGEIDRERVRMSVQRARQRAVEARAEGERARQAAYLARLHGERARVIGLQAGARGMEAGLRAIDEALERGEVTRYGETRPMTAEERAELLETRARLEARMAEFREEHAMFLGDDSDGQARVVVTRRDGADGRTWGWRDRSEQSVGRNVRIEDRDGRLRIWLDGEELEGDALTDWLNTDEGQNLIRQRPEPPLLGGE